MLFLEESNKKLQNELELLRVEVSSKNQLFQQEKFVGGGGVAVEMRVSALFSTCTSRTEKKSPGITKHKL